MVHNISARFIDRLISRNLIKEQEREFCCYGLETTLQKGISYSWIILIAIYFKVLSPTILFLIFFLSLRKYSGGFHASTYFRCFIGTLVIYCTVIFLLGPLLLRNLWVFFLLLAFSAAVIWFLAPVNHPNVAWDERELKECRKRTRKTLFLQLLGIAVAYALNIRPFLVVSAGLGTFMCGTLLSIAKILKQEVLRNEEGKR